MTKKKEIKGSLKPLWVGALVGLFGLMFSVIYDLDYWTLLIGYIVGYLIGAFVINSHNQ